MNPTGKTKQQLIDELAALQERISELEAIERDHREARLDFGERMGRYFPQVEHMNEAVYVIFDRKYEFVNKKFAELFCTTPEEVCSQNFDMMTLVAPESRRFLREKYRKGYRGEFSAQQYEYTGLTRDGSRIECETFVLFIPYKWGVAIHGLLRDISVRKRIDEELQRHRSDLQLLLNSIPTSIFYTDNEHRFLQVNESFCKSIGFPREEIIGRTLQELFPNLPAEQLQSFSETSQQVMRSGHSQRGCIEVFPSIRGRRWIQNDRIPYRDEEGRIIGVICLAIDISDYRETEEKLVYLSIHDALTGLYNRTYFEEELYRLENGRQFPISIITVTVKDLQALNDRSGIAAGNELLRRTARILKIFRTEDVVARVGGDRFAVLLPQADKAIGEQAIARLQESLAEKNANYPGDPLQLSFGVATGEKGCLLFEVLRNAEDAMR